MPLRRDLRLWRFARYWPLSLLALAVVVSTLAPWTVRFPGDLALARALQSLHAPWLDTLMRGATRLADAPVAIPSLLLAAAAVSFLRHWKDGAIFLLTLPLEGLLRVLKLLVDRPRPDADLVRVVEAGSSGGGFPSGHAFHAVLFLGLMWAVGVPDIPWRWLRALARVCLLSLIALIGASRVYLGLHWPSDVVAGVLWGVPAVAVLAALAKRWRRREPSVANSSSP
ncbi:MAG: phosphatase PAP2 family protein [Chloroflexi bacterium]|nr:phosphatase PAP2 family protein [Chloroflexota bacterium]